jgi:GxxExxY protein
MLPAFKIHLLISPSETAPHSAPSESNTNNIPFESQKKINISYKGKVLNKEYVADFICFGNIIVEIKAIKRITEIEEAQIINYLRATKLPLGLVINFGSIKLEWKRYINKK